MVNMKMILIIGGIALAGWFFLMGPGKDLLSGKKGAALGRSYVGVPALVPGHPMNDPNYHALHKTHGLHYAYGHDDLDNDGPPHPYPNGIFPGNPRHNPFL